MADIKFYITNFYNIRFLPTNVLPVSTAVWDPKWFHNNAGQDFIFLDKRGIYNGVRCVELSPYKLTDHSCGKECNQTPPECSFIKSYREYIYSLDFDKIYKYLSGLAERFKVSRKLRFAPEICLMVHEKPENPCSERGVLIDWFRNNNVNPCQPKGVAASWFSFLRLSLLCWNYNPNAAEANVSTEACSKHSALLVEPNIFTFLAA